LRGPRRLMTISGGCSPPTADEEPGAEPDPLNCAKSVRELYEIASPNYAGKPSVPVGLNLKNAPICVQQAQQLNI